MNGAEKQNYRSSQKLTESGQQQKQRESVILAVRRFMQTDCLTAPLLRELIDHIKPYQDRKIEWS